MPKVTRIVVSLKQGLPNYSSRSAEVEVTANEDESLPVDSTIKTIQLRIKKAWQTEGTNGSQKKNN